MKRIKKSLSLVLSLIVLCACFSYPVFASGSYPYAGAYSIGGEFLNGADVISACDYWALCGYSSYYHDNPTFSYVNSNKLNAYVLYFSAHGNQDAIYLLNNIRVSDGYIIPNSTTVDISTYTLDRPKLYVYDACLTASNGDGTGINLCSVTHAAGADCVIGWTTSIGVNDSFAWQQRFQNQLALGWTVQNAANYANGFSYNDNTSIKAWKIYGNKNIVIKVSSSSSISPYVENEGYSYLDLTEENIYAVTSDQEFFNSVLEKKFPDIILDNYNVTFTYTNDEKADYVVDYTYQVDNYSTKIGYSFIINDNRIIGIQANNIDYLKDGTLSLRDIPTVNELTIRNAYDSANEQVAARRDGSAVTEQKGEAFFDVATSTFYYRVMTVYKTGEGGYGAFFTFEKIK